MPEPSLALKRFDVALSFPGEHRTFVEAVAARLSAVLGKEHVLYDKFYEAEFARLNLNVYLPKLYRTQSELIVVFLCPEYEQKQWCKLEWRHIGSLIATIDESRIMLLRYGYEGDFSDLGILPGDGTIDFKGRTPEDIADRVIERFKINGGQIRTNGQPPKETVLPPPVDISRIDRYAPAELIGREAETKLIEDAWAKAVAGEAQRPRVMAFVALGGEGKTSLVAKWAVGMAEKGWPDAEAAFGWSFYSQGSSDQQASSSDLFLAEALKFFGAPAIDGESPHDKGRRLAVCVGSKRAALILDGLEPLQYPPTSPLVGQLKDEGLRALLKGLAQNSKGLCLVTTHYRIRDILAYTAAAPQRDLESLSQEAGAQLLQTLGVSGTQKEREDLSSKVRGHALTLNLIGSYLKKFFLGDIRKRDRFALEKANRKVRDGYAFHVVDAYVGEFESKEAQGGSRALALLRSLGLFDRPADMKCLVALWSLPAIDGLAEPLADLGEEDRNEVFGELADAKLLTMNLNGSGEVASLDAHPLLREYFAKALRENQPEAWRAGHKRLYEHLTTTTADKPAPTLEDLQPLYQAIAHGCFAGMQQEAYDEVLWKRIAQGNEAYSVKKLGAFGADLGAVACFFETPWTRVTPNLTSPDQAWLLNGAAHRLRALGRLTEALEPMRAALNWAVANRGWKEASVGAGNLSEMELSLGGIGPAIRDGEASVTHADRSGDAFRRMVNRTIHADALHQAGQRPEAGALFAEAEPMQAGQESEPPLLYSSGGFCYCDWLLADAERANWRRIVGAAGSAFQH
jgi:hypothetical protein